MSTEKESTEETARGSEEYWMKNVPRLVGDTETAMSYRDIIFEAYLTNKEKESGHKKRLLKLEERGMISIPNPINLRRAAWKLVDRGEVEFDLDRNLRIPEDVTFID